MQQSQQVAAAVALKAAGNKVVLTPVGAQVEEVGPGEPAVGNLEPDDVITAVDGKPVHSPEDVFQVMQPHKPGRRRALHVHARRQEAGRVDQDDQRPGADRTGRSSA